MKQFINFLAVTAVALLLPGCGQGTSPEIEGRLTEAVEKIEALQQKVDVLETQVNATTFLSTLDGVAYLTPGDAGFSVIKTNVGSLAVALEDVKPYANGSRVTLSLGNATGAAINGLHAKLEWGSVNDKGAAINETLKSKEAKFIEPLRVGYWTRVKVVLEGVPPSELGFVRMQDVGYSSIGLSK